MKQSNTIYMNTVLEQNGGRKDIQISNKNTIDKHGIIRFDFLFSYWMFVWFIIYYFLPTTIGRNSPITHLFKQYGNPLYVFYLGILENLATLGLLVWYNPDMRLIVKYIIMMCITKVYPAYLLYYLPTNWKINLVLFVFVFGTYNAYLLMNDTSFNEVYEKTLTSIIYDHDLTPLYAYSKVVWKWVVGFFYIVYPLWYLMVFVFLAREFADFIPRFACITSFRRHNEKLAYVIHHFRVCVLVLFPR